MSVTLNKASDHKPNWEDILRDNDLMELWAFFGESRTR